MLRKQHLAGKIVKKAAGVERPFYNVEYPESTFLQRKPLIFIVLRPRRRNTPFHAFYHPTLRLRLR